MMTGKIQRTTAMQISYKVTSPVWNERMEGSRKEVSKGQKKNTYTIDYLVDLIVAKSV